MHDAARQQLADEMLSFLQDIPSSVGLDWTRDKIFLYHFEAHRMQIIRALLAKNGFTPDREFSVLDFGYLHGLVPEFLHRAFPKARFTTCDLPNSPNFRDETFLKLIRQRDYLRLLPCDIKNVQSLAQKFDLIIMGEMIEHIDPTLVAESLKNLREMINENGLLLITTPNATGFYNSYMQMTGSANVIAAPIPDPVMGYGHIHLWSPAILTETARYAGWNDAGLEYYHGREGEMFTRPIHTLKGRVFVTAVKLIAERKPNRRGFFVAAYRPKPG